LKLHAIWQEDDRRAKPLHQFETAIVGGIREWEVRRKTLEFSVQRIGARRSVTTVKKKDPPGT